MSSDHQSEVAAIRDIVERQFASLNWTTPQEGDWQAFMADFAPGAALYPAARPAAPQTVTAFVERMKTLSQTILPSLQETVLGTKIHVFGNIAVAVAAGELVENGTTTTRNVEMLMLVKTDGAWRIVCQAWDGEKPGRPIPETYLEG